MLFHNAEDFPHLTPEEFCADADNIIEAVIQDGKAFVLETESNQYLLCPAAWLQRLDFRHIDLLAPYTLKYAFSQNTETSALIRADIRKRMHGFSYGTIEKMISDISAFLRNSEDDPSHAEWSALCADLREELTKTDTEEMTIELDIDLLVQAERYARARDITLQQLTEIQLERIVCDGIPADILAAGITADETPKNKSEERNQ